jgi:hypothetical protein
VGFRNPLTLAVATAAANAYTDQRTPVSRSGAGTYTTNASGDFVIDHNFKSTTGSTPNVLIRRPGSPAAVDTHSFAVRALTDNQATVRAYYNNSPLVSTAGVGVYFLVAGLV